MSPSSSTTQTAFILDVVVVEGVLLMVWFGSPKGVEPLAVLRQVQLGRPSPWRAEGIRIELHCRWALKDNQWLLEGGI